MASYFAALALTLLAPLSHGRAASAPHWTIDPARTRIAFSIDAIGYPRTQGTFDRFEGNLSVDFDHPDQSRVRFDVDAASADVGSGAFNDYLRSEALLNAAAFKHVVFASTSVKKTSEDTVEVVGTLSMLGVTQPLVVDVEVTRERQPRQERLGFVAKAKIDRLAFGMNTGYPVISRDIELLVTSEAVAE